jgi:hypothetical protein
MNRLNIKIAAAIGCSVLAACSSTPMVVSVPAIDNTLNPGILYSLPKQLVTVKYERKQLKVSETKAHLERETKASQEAEEKYKAKEAEEKAKIAQREAVSTTDPQSAQVILKLEQEITAIKAEKIVLLTKAKFAADSVAVAFNQYITALSNNKFSESLTIVPEAPIADTKSTFVAKLNSGISRSSNLNLKTINGLLEGATGVSEDKLQDIVVSLAGSISALVQESYAAKATALLEPSLDSCVNPKNFTMTIDPDSSDDISLLNILATQACLQITVTPPSTTPVRLPVAPINGLIYRATGIYEFKIHKCHSNPCSSLFNSPSIVRLPLAQGGALGVAEFDSANFTKNTYAYSFSKGSLTNSTIDQPSELLGLVQIVPNALKAIVAIPAEIIKLRVDYSSSEKALLENQKTMVETQLLLDQKLAELEAYRAGASSGN